MTKKLTFAKQLYNCNFIAISQLIFSFQQISFYFLEKSFWQLYGNPVIKHLRINYSEMI